VITGKSYANPNYTVVGGVGTPEAEGRDFCHDVGSQARVNALGHETAGWFLGGFALGAAGVGVGVVASDQPPDDHQAAKNRYKVTVAAAPLIAGLLAYLASGQFNKANASWSLAGSTTVAHDLDDKKANAACNAAIAAWVGDEKGASKAFADAIVDLTKAKDDSKGDGKDAGGAQGAGDAKDAHGEKDKAAPAGEDAKKTEKVD
jgi:hypothetical protein